MKNIIIASLLIVGVCINLQAQEEKKVIVKKVEKTEVRDADISTNGREKTVTINSDKVKIENENATLAITKEIINGKEKSVYKLTEDNDGEVKVIEWDGEGEMPAEIREKMKAVDVAIDGDDQKVIWIEKNIDASSPKGKKKHMKMHESMAPQPKVKLGVMISDHNNGVNVDEVFKGSSADKAGLEKGDVILKLNDKYIFSEEALFETLATFKEGEKISITVIRGNKEKGMNLTF
ncbi:MAG: PDZ domain-containing protein [Saprospiraceae bacterium]